MGWPGCMYEGCHNWPMVGFTGVCHECIKIPERVRLVAQKMNENQSSFTSRDFAESCRMAWLAREPEGQNLKMVLKVIEDNPGIDLRDAIDRARTLYYTIRSNAQ